MGARRIRSIRPEFCESEAIAELTIPAALHFVMLWTYTDDEGRGVDNGRLLKSALWPLRDEIDAEDVEEWQQELHEKGRIVRYEVDGKYYFAVTNWSEHQRPQHPKASTLPAPDAEKAHEVFRKRHDGSRSVTPVVVGVEVDVVGEGGVSSPAPQDDGFEEFWQAYPRRHGKRLEKGKAHSAWKRLKNPERESARRGVAHYRKACDNGITIAKDAFRWLRDSSFEDWQTPAVEAKSGRAPEPTAHYHKPFDVETDVPSCEHSTPICIPCRKAAKEAIRSIAAGIGEAS